MTEQHSHFSNFPLDKQLLKALTEQGYLQPTAIQSKTIALAMDGVDVMGSSPTGTGKTLAYLLPILQSLLDFPKQKQASTKILVLVPTRELALQVAGQAERLAKYTPLTIALITGGVAYMNHQQILQEQADLVIATTGRLLQYINEDNFDCYAIKTLVLDEADRMLDMGFAQDIEHIIRLTTQRAQTLLFSATLDSQDVYQFAKKVLNNPIIIETNASRRERKKIIESYYYADNFSHKTALLYHLLKQDEFKKVIIFVKTRERVHKLNEILKQAGIIHCNTLEGEMVQTKRKEAIARFDQDQTSILIATDIAARGIDIDNITHVINFDLPRHADIYLHRIGRTARAEKKGTAISLVEAHDYPILTKIERYLQTPIKSRTIDELKPTTNIPISKNTKIKKHSPKTSELEKKNKKVKVRARDKKNIGKRRKATMNTTNNQVTNKM